MEMFRQIKIHLKPSFDKTYSDQINTKATTMIFWKTKALNKNA